MNRLLLTTTLAGALLAVGAARAGVLYDNGPCNCQAYAPNIVAGNYARDSFTIGASAAVGGVEFVAWNYQPTDTTVSVDWAIFSGAPAPYTSNPLIASGTSAVTDTFLLNNADGYGVYADTFAIPSLPLASGTYTLALYDAVASNPGDQVYWDANYGPATAVIHTNFGPFEGYGPSETFQILGSPTAAPEPATWALMLIGIGGLGAALRRLRQVSAPSGADSCAFS